VLQAVTDNKMLLLTDSGSLQTIMLPSKKLMTNNLFSIKKITFLRRNFAKDSFYVHRSN